MKKQRQHPSNGAADAIALLVEDHQKVQKLFKEFDGIKDQDDDEGKQTLVQTICTELTIHAQLEEEIFYPAARDALDDDDLFDEAEVEHTSAKDLISQLEAMEPYEELYNAKVTVLGEYINHHVKEEQEEMFPKVKKSKLDLQRLGVELTARKRELQSELGVDQPSGSEDADEIPSNPGRGSEQRHSTATRTS